MTVIGAFLSTWSHTRRTFGNGTPVSGAQYDNSDSLHEVETSLESAAPGPLWSGSAATDYGDANIKQRHVIGRLAELDQRLASEIDRSAHVVEAGRRDLENVRQRVVDAAASVPDGQAGERMKIAIAQTGLEQLREIVQRSNAESNDIGERISGLGDEYQALDAPRFGQTANSEVLATGQGVDFKSDIPEEPPPLVPGQPVDPANPFIGDQRFGHWQPVIAPPYTGTTPPPLTRRYRPFPEETPLKIGGTTGWYTPGKNWAADPPYMQYQEQYRFRIAGREATTYTRMVHQDGRWQQERWVRNVYEYQRSTQMTFSGDVSVRGRPGDLAGLGSYPLIDYEWKPIALNEIATLSARNTAVTYYLPDGCGGQFTYQGGVPVGGASGLPPTPPVMTRPR
jgi:hypothetical protein